MFPPAPASAPATRAGHGPTTVMRLAPLKKSATAEADAAASPSASSAPASLLRSCSAASLQARGRVPVERRLLPLDGPHRYARPQSGDTLGKDDEGFRETSFFSLDRVGGRDMPGGPRPRRGVVEIRDGRKGPVALLVREPLRQQGLGLRRERARLLPGGDPLRELLFQRFGVYSIALDLETSAQGLPPGLWVVGLYNIGAGSCRMHHRGQAPVVRFPGTVGLRA